MKLRSKEDILSSMINNFNMDIPIYEGTITHAIFSSVANAIAREYTIKDEEEKQIFLVDGRNNFLDKRAWEFGYDRKEGKNARGIITFVTASTEIVPEGLTISCNGVDFVTLHAGQLSENSVDIHIMAVNVGSAGNIKAESNFKCEEMYFERIYNKEDLTGGIDIESDEDFNTRFFYTQRNKGTSGNEDHYNEWAKEVDGVVDSKTTGLKYGNGTVEVVVAGANNVVSSEVVNATKVHIDSIKPIGVSVTVKSMSDYSLSITAKVKASDVKGIEKEYRNIAGDYLLKSNEVIYSKMYSLLANIESVADVVDFKINGSTSNIKIDSQQKAKIGDIKFEVMGDV